MRSAPPELVVVGGELGPHAGLLVDAVSAGLQYAVDHPAPVVLVWDEPDRPGRWGDHAEVFEVRARPVRHGRVARRSARAAQVLAGIELRRLLHHHRRSDVIMVGRAALGAAPWLTGHRGHRIWLPTLEDLDDLDGCDDLDVPGRRDGGPTTIGLLDARLAASPKLIDDPRSRPIFDWVAVARPVADPPYVLALGALDRQHGFDLVVRAVAARQQELRAAGGHLLWIAPHGSHTSPELGDVRAAGVRDLIRVVACDDVRQVHAEAAAPAAALLLAGRAGASRPDESTIEGALLGGVPVISARPGAASARTRVGRSSEVYFASPRAFGDVLVDAVRRPRPLPPEAVGLRALVDQARR